MLGDDIVAKARGGVVVVSKVAPVVLLGYRRPHHLRSVFEAIKTAKPPVLFLVMDGPKPNNQEDAFLVQETREMVERVDWDCEVHRLYAKQNLGLKARVSSGLDEVFQIVDHAIILEDDCLPSPTFFAYASELLVRYQDDERVGLVSGSSRLRGKTAGRNSYDFSRDVRIWGWATWSRTWQDFRSTMGLDSTWTREEAKTLGRLFAPGPRRRSMVSMMEKAAALDSWALPFAVHCAQRGYLNPVSRVNLIRNIGLGEGSTHTGFENYVVDVPLQDIVFPLRHPERVEYLGRFDEMESKRDALEVFFYPLRHPWDTTKRLYRFALKRLNFERKKWNTID